MRGQKAFVQESGGHYRLNCNLQGRVRAQDIIEMAAVLLQAPLARGNTFSSPETTRLFVQARLQQHPYEVFAVLFLDNRHRLLAFEEMFRGTIDASAVYPREVVRRALIHNAAAVIFAHNHPSGITEPSRADKLLTQRLKDALALIDVRVLDHLIVGEGNPFSFAERGLL